MTLENHNQLILTPILVVLKPTSSSRRIEFYYASCSHVWCDVNFVPTLFFVLLRVDEQVTEEPEAPQVEDSEQELAEGKLCP
jgi:hypothetical protein